MFFCGIDIDKFSHVASVIDSDGNIIKTFAFNNSNDGFNSFISYISSNFDDSDFAKLLHIINPIQSEALRNLFIKSNKSDSIDSFIIAEVIRINRFTSTTMADDNTMAMRELTRFRTYQAQTIASLKLKAIKVIFPEYSSAFTDTFGKTSMDILLNFPTPDQVMNISVSKLTNFIKKASKGRLGESKALFLKNITSKSVGISVGIEGFIFKISAILNQIKFTEGQIKELYLSFDVLLYTIALLMLPLFFLKSVILTDLITKLNLLLLPCLILRSILLVLVSNVNLKCLKEVLLFYV